MSDQYRDKAVQSHPYLVPILFSPSLHYITVYSVQYFITCNTWIFIHWSDYVCFLQIMEYDMRRSNIPWKLYYSYFSVHFSPMSTSGGDKKKEEERNEKKMAGRYEPTIVCYNKHDHVMEVRTDRHNIIISSYSSCTVHYTCRYAGDFMLNVLV